MMLVNYHSDGEPFHPDDLSYAKRPSDEWYIKQSVGYLKAHDFLKREDVYFEREELLDAIWKAKENL